MPPSSPSLAFMKLQVSRTTPHDGMRVGDEPGLAGDEEQGSAPRAPDTCIVLATVINARDEAHLVEGERTDDQALLEQITTPEVRMRDRRDEDPDGCRVLSGPGPCAGLRHFGTFAVDPRHQAAGIGGWLTVEAERVGTRAFAAGMLELTVLARQVALIAWYEHRGFICTGE